MTLYYKHIKANNKRREVDFKRLQAYVDKMLERLSRESFGRNDLTTHNPLPGPTLAADPFLATVKTKTFAHATTTENDRELGPVKEVADLAGAPASNWQPPTAETNNRAGEAAELSRGTR